MAGIQILTSLLFLNLFVTFAKGDDLSSMEKRCATEASKLTECVGYASGEEAAPTGECCGSVTEVKGKDPTCLCLVIRQAHNGGSGGVSSLHLRLDRLLSLPKACALANSSVSYCPKLLNLPPNSPDSAIFTNASYANSSSPASSTGSPSGGTMNNVSIYSALLVVAASAVFLLFFQIAA